MRMVWTICAAAMIATAALAQETVPDLSGKDPHWIEDKNNHCWAANAHPDVGETVSWIGACVNKMISGFGRLTWYRNGRVQGQDEGTYKNGELTGHGRIVLDDGTVYDGQFPGTGTLTLPDGRQLEAMSVKEVAGWSIEEVPPPATPTATP